MKKISLFIIVNAISLFIVSSLMSSVYIGSLKALLTLTIIFGCLNVVVKPILNFLSLPLTILSLGLFSFVVNAFILKLAFDLVSDASISGFLYSILAAFLLSIVNSAVSSVLE